MTETLSYEERNAKLLETKKKLFFDVQTKIAKEKLNLYGFEIVFVDPINKINTDRGFFTSAYITFKHISFGHIVPSFNITEKSLRQGSPEPAIESFIIHRTNELTGSINYSRSEDGKEELEFKYTDHMTIQSCLDELEKIRIEIANFYST